MISSVDPNYVPKDATAENTERMTGGTQTQNDLDVGEIEGGKFKVEPLRRSGEDDGTMRARLLCPSLIDSIPDQSDELPSLRFKPDDDEANDFLA